MSKLTDRIGTESAVMPGDVKGCPVTAESDFSIVGFPSVGSCLSDLPQQVAGGPTNRFQVIAANIDSWRARISARLNRYALTIAGLLTSSSSTSHACEVNARAASSNNSKLESFSERLDRMEVRASNNHDSLLAIQDVLDNLRACSDSQLSWLLNQSQILRGAPQLIPSLHAPTVSAEITVPKSSVTKEGSEEKTKDIKRLIAKAGSASTGVRGSKTDRSEHV